MVGIEEIAVYIPPARISNFGRKTQFNFDDQFIEEKLGVAQVAVKGKDEKLLTWEWLLSMLLFRNQASIPHE
jgi:3-oxoacyl-[acyl-carrier-protein] synthase-3